MIAASLLMPQFTTKRTMVSTNTFFFFFLSGLNQPRISRPPMLQPRATSQPPLATKSVQFDLGSPSASSSLSSSSLDSPDQIRQRRQQWGGATNPLSQPFPTDESPRSHRHHQHRRHASQTELPKAPSPTHSDMTIDLPERFDQHGRRKPERGEDAWADKFEDFLNGKGVAGMFLEKLTSGLGSGGGRDRDGGRRRRRKR